MRIFTFLLSAATLHVVLLALTFDNAGQHAAEHQVGVALVQRQWEQPVANAGQESRNPAPGISEEEAPVEKKEHQQPDTDPEKLDETSFQEHVVDAEVPPPDVDVNQPVVIEDRTAQKPDVIEQSPEFARKVTQISSSPSGQQTDGTRVNHEMLSLEVSGPQTQNQTNDSLITSVQTAVAGTQPETTSQAPRQAVQEQAQPHYGYNPAPAYPSIARRRGWEGTVEFNVRVLASGQVDEVQLTSSSGYRSLDNAARRAILTWRFNPATKNDRSVESWVVIPVQFVLDDRVRSR